MAIGLSPAISPTTSRSCGGISTPRGKSIAMRPSEPRVAVKVTPKMDTDPIGKIGATMIFVGDGSVDFWGSPAPYRSNRPAINLGEIEVYRHVDGCAASHTPGGNACDPVC